MERIKNSVISFSGMDGSGKTTYAVKLCEYLKHSGRRAVLLNIYQMSLVLNIGKMLGGEKNDAGDKGAPGGGKESRAKIILRSAALFIDIAVFVILSTILEIRGTYIVCDRYLYDTLAHILYKGKLSAKTVDLYLRIIPRAQLAFLLSADANTAKARENAHDSVDYFYDKDRIYKDLGKTVAFDIVKTDGSVDSVWETIENKVNGTIRAI